jgi:hypothetical protein
VTVRIDRPAWPAHGRLWAHLISDTSLDELHAFAAHVGVPRRGFERDHYDVPEEVWERLVAAGAVPTPSREIVALLRAAGMRRPKYPARRATPAPADRPLTAGDRPRDVPSPPSALGG